MSGNYDMTVWQEIQANARSYPGSAPAMSAVLALAVFVLALMAG